MNETLNGWAKQHPIGGAVVLVLRAVFAALGLALVALAIPLTPLPIPLGIPFFALGLILLAAASTTAHRLITGVLRRYPFIWRRVRFAFGGRKKDEPAE